MLSLTQVKLNKKFIICGYQNLTDKILRRICDLGLTEGQSVRVKAKSLLKKALLIEVRGYELTIKADIASGIIVK